MTNKQQQEISEELKAKYGNNLILEKSELGFYHSLKVDYFNDFLPFLFTIIDKVLAEETKEIVICSGIKLEDGRVLRCHRHGDGMINADREGWKLFNGVEQQGFVTSKGRYVTRQEGRILQDLAGIKSVDPEGYRGDTLFSEDLY